MKMTTNNGKPTSTRRDDETENVGDNRCCSCGDELMRMTMAVSYSERSTDCHKNNVKWIKPTGCESRRRQYHVGANTHHKVRWMTTKHESLSLKHDDDDHTMI